jgi:hypothetical protein
MSMVAPAFPSSAPSSPAGGAPPANWPRYLTRPGSIQRSTSFWWSIPPVIAWVCLSAAALLTHAVDPSLELASPILWALFLDLLATSAWLSVVVLSQKEKDTELDGGQIDPVARHEFWRARTIAWDLLTVSALGALLTGFLIAGPSTILPSGDVPLVELTVLVATVLLLATFSRYAAMAFNTDAARMIQKLDELSTRESEARTRDTDRVTRLFTEQTDRIVAKADAQIEATATGFSAAVSRLDRVAEALEDLTKVERDSKSATEAAAEAQRRGVEDQRRLAVERKADETRRAEERALLIRPEIWVRLRAQGLIRHHLFVDVSNQGFDAVGLDVGVFVGQARHNFTETRLAAKNTRSFDLGDVTQLPQMVEIAVVVILRDVDGYPHKYGAGPFNYAREANWLNWTKSLSINPGGWVTASLLP